MHWNAIEYARGEVVFVWRYQAWYRGEIAGVHVQPGQPVIYYVKTIDGVGEYLAAQVRRVKQ